MADVKITIRLNGPYIIEGPVDLVDQDGNAFTVPGGGTAVLCRCGRSANKPFCNGAHRNEQPEFDAPTRAT
jgi:CDGSH-type Zn-finger protein